MLMIKDNLIRIVINMWALSGILLLCGNSLQHLAWSGFIDHTGEVNFVSVSWLLYDGHPLYTALDAPERYSLEHGPIAFLVIGGIMKVFGHSPYTAKLVSFLSVITIIIISYLWFTEFFRKEIAFWLLGLEAWLLSKWYYVYLARTDILMILCMTISLYFATTRKSRLAVILGTSIPLGIIINLKFHGIFYALPILVLILKKQGWKALFTDCLLIACVATIPFLLPNISLLNYIAWVKEATVHGFSDQIIKGNLSMAFLLLLVPVSIHLYFGSNPLVVIKRNGLFLGVTIISIVIVSLIGGKNGSGSHHLAPFVPLIIYFIIVAGSPVSSIFFIPRHQFNRLLLQQINRGLLLLIFLTTFLNAINAQGRMMRYSCPAYSVSANMLSELQDIQAKYRGLSMMIGYGENHTNKIYDQLIPLLVVGGNKYLLDYSALSDMKASGLPIPESTKRKMDVGETRIWLIPANNIPFNQDIFDELFRLAFRRNYVLIEKTQYFDIWQYSGEGKWIVEK
ncbi:MAG: glycosyltransferase family 39 protein [Negativicutes bacterium]|nr:glycosyltransferase family 39 protein [Negativicutes bacterium]